MMFESRAICRYLNRKVGGALEPADLRGRAMMEQWMSVEQAEFTPAAMKLIYNYVFWPMMGKDQDSAMITDGNAGVTACLEVMDRRLASSTYLAGDQFTLADVNFLPYVEYLMASPAKELFGKHAHVMAWWNRCQMTVTGSSARPVTPRKISRFHSGWSKSNCSGNVVAT